ncbi:BRCA2-interacting transcriptional repressor EMSY isoform X2 [Anoplophora glabripennis]|uniref:BRCA2-interacting transcriptional repressor EMSY isoform X2 n=1 Tax=Anoplophora glabripennis TaxID=217634 RepID=UPI000874C010|nr:BRCA2-interacting transcriptional repressor EMSY isoform X2 [Anoplophora glabripennis]
MWPLLLDMTKEESVQNLRNLELEAYSHLVSALRAQGPLNSDKRKLLKETGIALNITQERHKAEVRRAISDEKLNTIAYHVTGHTESLEDWAQEGRRLVPLLPRTAPQTAFSALADETAEVASQNPPKVEDSKKRKLCPENSSLAQHLLAPKVCRIQQLYRQRSSKTKTKDLHKKPDQDQLELIQQQHRVMQQVPQPVQHQTTICPLPQQPLISQKVNVLQNISLQSPKEEPLDQEEVNANIKLPEQVPNIPVCANENQAPRPKLITNIKPNTNITIKQTSAQPPGPSTEMQKSIKMCSAKKPVTKTVNSGQKLIVVSNAQTIPTNSILQRTLQIPFVKNVSIKNFEKFKIVTSNSVPTNIQVANTTNSGVNSVKHKVVTVKTNPTTKKVIPFSQLQVLNSKGSIKVLPLGGKIVGKTMSASSSPLYIMNTVGASQPFSKSNSNSQAIATAKVQVGVSEDACPAILENGGEAVDRVSRENGKSSVLADILKASGVISDDGAEDYDTKIEEFHIPQNKTRDVGPECVGIEAVAGEEEVSVKTEPGQDYGYAVLPVQVPKEEQNDFIKTELYDGKDDPVSNELIEPETLPNQLEELKVETEEEDASTEEAPRVIVQSEVSKPSDINESN